MSHAPLKPSSRWSFEDGATPLDQVIRSVERDGPQLVSVEGLGEVVVISVDDFSRFGSCLGSSCLGGEATGQSLVDAFAASPHRDVELAVGRGPMPVRDVPS